MAQALAGLRVLELGRIVAAPWCGQTLGDLGAEVIKIERPGCGDDLRSYGPVFARDAEGGETAESGHFLCVNRNKKSVTVDISKPEGASLVRALARNCDILIENYKVGDLVRYGLDYESLRTEHPNLIYCSVTGFGQTGPYAHRPGYDAAFQGMSGMMAVTGDPEGPPQRVGVFVIDEMAGLYAAVAILAALRHRDLAGGGQHIDLALFDVGIAAMAPRTIEWTLNEQIPERLGTRSPGSAPAQVFRCADGHLNIQAGGEADYRKLCDALGCEELKEDPRFSDRKTRVRNQDALYALLAPLTAKRTTQDLLGDLEMRGVVASPVYRADEMARDPHVVARGLHFWSPHPLIGQAPMTASPLRLSATPIEIYTAPPTLGQHTDEVLAELLGYSPDRLEALRAAAVI
jgi:crotonobetainyl-CoA:carnitine CoA-transferase CaiB-like acyl-CoA transferase